MKACQHCTDLEECAERRYCIKRRRFDAYAEAWERVMVAGLIVVIALMACGVFGD